MYSFVKEGSNVLVLWGTSVDSSKMKNVVERLRELTGHSGKVSLENIERLDMASYATSSFDVVLSGVLPPPTVIHSVNLLGKLAELVKPQGVVVLHEAVVPHNNGNSLKTMEKLNSVLKLSGFIDITQAKSVALEDKEAEDLKSILKTNECIKVVEVHCKKPNFEVGSAISLPFVLSAKAKPSSDVTAVWKLDSTDDIETIDADTLLDENDLKKPDPSSLKVCGTTGKRKACKNCTCGLADELQAEAVSKVSGPTKTSACGNCYLGDAFRCATCPYLGMPAFKPGEKIQLTTNQLKADL